MTMMDDFDMDGMELDETPPEESSNRTFLLVAGVLGAILILSLICMAVYAMVIVPQSRSGRETQVAEINIQNTEVAHASNLTAVAAAWTPTVTKTEKKPTNTSVPTSTPLLAVTDTPVSDQPQPTQDPRTATVAALLTIQAGGDVATSTPSPTELPDTGFADDIGIPGFLALASALILVIFLMRRFRTAS